MSIDTVNALTTLIKAKAWLGVAPAPDTTDDDEIERLIDSVSWQFNSFTKRRLLSRTLTEYYEGDGTNKFMSPEYPYLLARNGFVMKKTTAKTDKMLFIPKRFPREYIPNPIKNAAIKETAFWSKVMFVIGVSRCKDATLS